MRLEAMGLADVRITLPSSPLMFDLEQCVHVSLQSRHPHLSNAGNPCPGTLPLSSLAGKSELCRESHLVRGKCGLSLLPKPSTGGMSLSGRQLWKEVPVIPAALD